MILLHSGCTTARYPPARSARSANNTPPHGFSAAAGAFSTVTGIAVMATFVEVKTRRTLRYGTPQEAVTASKQINLRHAAVQWLMEPSHRVPHNGVRFDVITVIVRAGRPLVHHIEGAF